MRRNGSLGSIHYDDQLIIDLWNGLSDYGDSDENRLTVYYGSGSTTFETPQEYRNATQIPDRLSQFELSIESPKGTLQVNSRSNKHEYRIQGEEDWVRRMTDYIEEFASEQKIR